MRSEPFEPSFSAIGERELKTIMDDDYRFGWLSFRPNFLQRFKSVNWALFFLCLAPCIQGVLINGMLHYFLTTLEKSFRLSSVLSGLMCGGYDIASLLCLIPVTYWGGFPSTHKPRWIGGGIIIMGVGSLIFSIPAFMKNDILSRNEHESELCNFKNYSEKEDNNIGEGVSLSFLFLFLGNFLQGVGGSPIFTLAVTYLDENMPKDKRSIYFGIYFSMVFVGPGLGFLFGANFNKLDTNFPFEYSNNYINDPGSPFFIGCWWLGFIIFGVICFFIAIPILGLPKSIKAPANIQPSGEALEQTSQSALPSNQRADGERCKNANCRKLQKCCCESFSKAVVQLKGLPRELSKLLSNPVFIALSLTACCEVLLISGFGVFLPKILQFQFNISVPSIAIFFGAVVLPGAIIGTLLGGWLISRLKLNLRSIIGSCFVSATLALVGLSSVLISCTNDNVVGLTIPYMNSSENKQVNLTNECNKNCNCDNFSYNPVCSYENKMYFSACFAGCKKVTVSNGIKEYSDCSCITKVPSVDFEARMGPCYWPCNFFPLFIILLFLYQVSNTYSFVPGITATLSCVKEESKSLAMGVQWIIVRSFGAIPGPVIFGILIDKSCVHPLQGHFCPLYNSSKLSWYVASMGYSLKILELFSLGIAMASLKKERT